MLGALIGAGASLLGGLMGGEESSKTKSKTRTRSTTKTRTNLKMMVRQAERNGFNPLTVLQAGGMAAFSNTSSFSNSKMKGKGSSSSSSPLAAGIAGAGAAIGGAIDNAPSATALNAASAWQGAGAVGAATNKAEYDALQSQLKSVQPGTLGTQPRIPVSSTVSAVKPALGNGSDGGFVQPTYEAPTVTNPFPQDTGIKIDPLFPDATERYESELFQTGFDFWRGYRDIKKNVVESKAYNDAVRDIDAMKEKYLPKYTDPNMYKGMTIPGIVSKPWDSPAITMGLEPVVTVKPKPDMYRDPFPAWSW